MRDGVEVTDPILKSGSGNTAQAASYIPGVAEKRAGVPIWLHGATSNFAAESDASQALTATIEQDAFGNTVQASRSWRGKAAYAGQYGIEQEDGVSLIGARWYDQEVGRFLTRDPAYDGPNWFAYCANNPASFVDYDGQGFGPTVHPPALRGAPSAPPISLPVHFPPSADERLPKPPPASNEPAPDPFTSIGGLGRLSLILLLIMAPANLDANPKGDMLPSSPIPGGKPITTPYPPAPGYEWCGPGKQGHGPGSWYNPQTGEQLHPHSPDAEHPDGHWDYTDQYGGKWIIDPETGNMTPDLRRGKQKKRGRNKNKGKKASISQHLPFAPLPSASAIQI